MARSSVPAPRAFSLALLLAVCGSFGGTASATWSIVATDRATGEVVVAGATCLAGLDLKKGSAVMLVGVGGAAAQSALDGSGTYRRIIWDELLRGTPPETILEILDENDTRHQDKQYGIVDLQGRSVSFSGSGDGEWAGHAFGTVGTLAYAIQGNVLTGSPVIEKAKQALLETDGDLVTRVIAAMLAARDMGGDGRCSCSFMNPTQCGSPPRDFDKSAHVSYLALSRIGDVDGDCTKPLGCVNGSYYLDLSLPLRGTDPDPIYILAKEVEKWRTGLSGHPDHIHSRKDLVPDEVRADGASTSVLTVGLRDVEDDPIKHGGALVTVAHDPTSAHSSTIGPVVDHGNGTYSCTITAGTTAGIDVFRVVADDGIRPVTLYPFPELAVVPPLWSHERAISASDPRAIAFSLHGPARAPYLLTVSPPLVRSRTGAAAPGLPAFFHVLGRLDGVGAARVSLAPPAGVLEPIVGIELPFQFFTLPDGAFISNAWPVLVTD